MRRLVRRFFSTKRCFSTTIDEKTVQAIRTFPLQKQYPGFKATIQQSKGFKIRTHTDLRTNLNFLIDSPGFPGCTDLGICIKLGTRDQDTTTAGSMRYLQNFAHSKQTLEETVQYYDIFQKSGSFFKFDYDTSYTYIKCSCFSEDVELMLDLLLDLALSEKRVMDGKQLMESQITEIGQATRITAYGGKGLGMPSSGIGNTLRDENFRAFQQKITPFNTIFSFSNYPDEQKLIQLITSKIQSKYSSFLKRPSPKRQPANYTGGCKTFFNPQTPFFQFALAYESCSHSDKNMELMNVLRVLLGSASSFSSGGPGKGMYSRCFRSLLNTVACVEKASFINQHFSDSGLFGLTVGGMEDYHKDVIKATTDEFKRLLQPVPDEQLERAKNILVASIYSNTQGQPERLEQATKHIFSYGHVKLQQYEQLIRAVTPKQIQECMRRIVKGKPTIVGLSSYDRGDKYLRQQVQGLLP